MGDAQGSIGDTQGGVWTYWMLGASGWCLNVWGHPNIWGVSRYLQTYGGVKSMPQVWKLHATKENMGVWTYGDVGGIGGHPDAWVASKYMEDIWTLLAMGRGDLGNTWQLSWAFGFPSYFISYHFVILQVPFGRGVWCRNMDVPMVESDFIIYQ